MNYFRAITVACGITAALMTAGQTVLAETPVGSSVESRVILGFKVDDARVASALPEGWKPITLPKGPLTGVNLMFVLMDRHLVLDAEGKPMERPSDRIGALVAYGVSPDVEGVRTYVTHVLETPPMVDTYGNSVAVTIDRAASTSASGGGLAQRSEAWRIAFEGGGSIAVDLDYAGGRPAWVAGSESRPHSSENPDFFRIYRFDQLVDLAMNSAIGRALDGTVAFAAEGGALGEIFDGSEELIAVMAVPVYTRAVSLP